MSDNSPASLEKIDARLTRLLPATDLIPFDEMLSVLQDAFQDRPVVLLTGEDGSGRSATAAQFAQQQVLSGAMGENPVLYTSFLTCRDMTELLDGFGQVYEKALLDRQINWQNLEDFQRLKLVQDVLKKVSLLWVWDDFDEITGNPYSDWDHDQMSQLRELLNVIPAGAAKVLILSGREAPEFLDGLPVRVQLELSCRNPLARAMTLMLPSLPGSECGTLREMVEKALQPFLEQEKKLLLLSGLFTGLFHVDAVARLAEERALKIAGALPELDRESILDLYTSASRRGLFSSIVGGYFLIHPAIRNGLRSLMKSDFRKGAERAFPGVMAYWARTLTSQVQEQKMDVMGLLAVEEANFKVAILLTRKFHGRAVLFDLLAAVRLVFLKSRRWASWEQLLDRVSPSFVDPETQEPVQTSRNFIVTYYDWRVEIAEKREHYTRAVHWQALKVMWERKQAPVKPLGKPQGNILVAASLRLPAALADLALIYRVMASPKAIEAYQEAYQLVLQMDQKQLASRYARQIAEAYLGIPVVRNFDQANEWVRRSLNLLDEQQEADRCLTLAIVGKIISEKFLQSLKDNRPAAEKVELLNEALAAYFHALDSAPDHAYAERANLHESIGYLYLQSDAQLEVAIDHYETAIRCYEQIENLSLASKTRFNLAVALFLINHFERSQQYAQAALAGFDALGLEAFVESQKVAHFLARFPSPPA